MSLRFKYNI